MEKTQKKKLQQEFRRTQKQDFLASLPMAQSLFEKLFDCLDEKLGENGCDHSLKITTKFLQDNGVDVAGVEEWLKQYGGYCDCEALGNVEQYFE